MFECTYSLWLQNLHLMQQEALMRPSLYSHISMCIHGIMHDCAVHKYEHDFVRSPNEFSKTSGHKTCT